MSAIWCDLVAAVIDGRLQYRGVVRCEGRAEWKGKWTESKLQACRDADKMAEKIYDLNHNVLTVRRTVDVISSVSGRRNARRPRQ